jgi:excisionase family DNA binding protein
MTNIDDNVLLRPTEVARMLGLGRSKVYELIGQRKLPVIRIGTAVRVPKHALLDWIDKNTMTAT